MNAPNENLHIYIDKEFKPSFGDPMLFDQSEPMNPALAFGMRAIFERAAGRGRKIGAVRFETIKDALVMLEIGSESSIDFVTMPEFISHLGITTDVRYIFQTDCSDEYVEAWQAFLSSETVIPPICRKTDLLSSFALAIARKGGVELTLALVQEVLGEVVGERGAEKVFAHAHWMRGQGEQLVADRNRRVENSN